MIDRNLYFPAVFFQWSRGRVQGSVTAAIDPPQIITRHVTRAICASAVYASISRQKAICRPPSNGGRLWQINCHAASNVPSVLVHPCKTRPALLDCQSVPLTAERWNDSLKFFFFLLKIALYLTLMKRGYKNEKGHRADPFNLRGFQV